MIALPGYQPEMCKITLPNLEQYARRIGADFNVITKQKFPDYPPNYERLQIFEYGKDYRWNINIDADTILHPEFEDPTERLDPRSVAALYSIELAYYFTPHRYFLRDGRARGIADNFAISSWLTHELWEPLNIPFEQARKLCLRDERQVSEYCLSLNMCKYGFRLDGVTADLSKHYSIMATDRKIENPAKMMREKLREWGNQQ